METSLPWFLATPDPEVYNSNNFVVLDFETTNTEYGTARLAENTLIMASWWDNETRVLRHCYKDEYNQASLLRDIEKADYIVAHNAKFELGWLARCGMERGTKLVACTQIAEYVIAGNRKMPLDLDSTLDRRNLGGKLDHVSKCVKAGIPFEYLPRNRGISYCNQDVMGTLSLWIQQRKEMNTLGLLPVFYTRCLLTPVLEDIERRGMFLDRERVNAVYARYTQKLNQLLEEFDEFSGGINVKSQPQMAEFIYTTLKFAVPKDFRGKPMVTGTGLLPTDSEAIHALVAKTKRQNTFKYLRTEISKYQEAVTKYLKKLKECADGDGLLFAKLNQTISRTHRLTSTGSNYSIQFQNMQREFKPLFRARNEGWKIHECDQAQLEYRVAVDLSHDEAGMEDISNGVDSHSITAEIIFKKPWAEVADDKKNPLRKDLRTKAKAHTFKPLYGGQSGTPEQREYYEFFLSKHKQLRELQDSWIHQVLDSGQLKTVTGLIFYWPDTRVSRSGYVANTTSICNYPVQMLATGDIVPIGLVYTWHRMKANEMQSFLINTVHDSQVAEICPEERELYEEIAVQSQERDVVKYLERVYDYHMVVPLSTESASFSNWSDSEEWQQEFLF